MKLFFRVVFLFAALVALPLAAHAQYAVGVSFTAQHIVLYPPNAGDPNGTGWVLGPTFSFQHEHGRFIKFGFDARAELLGGQGADVASRSFDIGPRLAIAPRILPFKVYGEVLIGGMGVRPTPLQKFTTHFDLQEVIGVDYTVIPHVDWRLLEFAHGNVLGLTGVPDEDTRNQLSTGIVVRF